VNNSEFPENHKIWIPDGFHFLGPESTRLRQEVIDFCMEFFQKNGYSQVIPPSLDYSELFGEFLSPEAQDLLLETKDKDGNRLSPSTDLTLQVVKGLAPYLNRKNANTLVFYFGKRIQDHLKRNGSRREVFQVGVERVGSPSFVEFKTLVKDASNCLDEILPLEDIKFVFGHSVIWDIVSRDIHDKELKFLFYKYFTSKNKERCSQILSESKINPKVMDWILNHLWESSIEKIQDSIPSLVENDTIVKEIQTELELCKSIPGSLFDISLPSQLSYYTGMYFQVFHKSSTEAILKGGIYDHLFDKFHNKSLGACGFALNLSIVESFSLKKRSIHAS
jgi:ATP phosphoribosyltransferase regulatory subunit